MALTQKPDRSGPRSPVMVDG
eukprot:SAG31_NODE_37723_length_302_cov_0.443350_1_plen_20_part_01